jgi:UDP-N-acetylglucosamine 2-epimerase (non-hydrolysing)
MHQKVLVIFGTRPEAIKLAPLIKEFQACSDVIDLKTCVTGQHRSMLDQILTLFNIEPDYDLDLMEPGQDLSDLTGRVLKSVVSIIRKVKPDMVIVQGDTTTSFASALAAFYEKVEVGHVEAGLRTNNPYAPFPEELNRQITSRLSTYHFAPTQQDKRNLIKENISPDGIIVTGNTVIDALLWVLDRLKQDPDRMNTVIHRIHQCGYPALDRQGDKKIILVTGHRRENFGQGFINICNGIKNVAETHPHIDIVYPVHLNPNVNAPVRNRLSGIENVHLVTPLDYEAFLYLMSRSYILVTDSGGLQEEAPSVGIPVLVMRENTERPAAVEAGTAILIGTDTGKMEKYIHQLLSDPDQYQRMANKHNPFGDGQAAKKICRFIQTLFSCC